MAKTFKVCHIICEGASEIAYCSELGKHLRETGSEWVLNLYNLDGNSSYSKIKIKYRDALRKKNKTDEIFIWLDNDVFKRGKFSKSELHRILKGFSGIKYNHENFEDFLVMHLPDNQVHIWHETCRRHNHFDEPLSREKVQSLIKSTTFPTYTKGHNLPIQINNESLQRLEENQKKASIKFKSDFLDVIRCLSKISN